MRKMIPDYLIGVEEIEGCLVQAAAAVRHGDEDVALARDEPRRAVAERPPHPRDCHQG